MFSGFKSHTVTKTRYFLLTGNAGEELAREALNLAVRERNKAVALEKVKDTLVKQVHDDTDVAAVIKTVSEVDASVTVLLVVSFEGLKNAKFNSGGIPVFLD
ncbi:hypothetical protein HG531_011391 [Fusarium graminearum]|nr:hypothetical protein HG531_011391 [Fusarium graminearum]